MAEYISRETVLKAFKLTAKNPNKDYQRGMQDTIDCLVPEVIAGIPAADVQPIKKGYWYHNTSKYISELDAYFIQACCSCCGKYSDRVDLYSTIMSNEMCSHCGARMDGEQNG